MLLAISVVDGFDFQLIAIALELLVLFRSTDEEKLNESRVEICTIQRKSCSYGTDEEKLNESRVEICTIQAKSYLYSTNKKELNYYKK